MCVVCVCVCVCVLVRATVRCKQSSWAAQEARNKQTTLILILYRLTTSTTGLQQAKTALTFNKQSHEHGLYITCVDNTTSGDKKKIGEEIVRKMIMKESWLLVFNALSTASVTRRHAAASAAAADDDDDDDDDDGDDDDDDGDDDDDDDDDHDDDDDYDDV